MNQTPINVNAAQEERLREISERGGSAVPNEQLDQISASWASLSDLKQPDLDERRPLLLSVVIPVFNECSTVAAVITKVAAIPVPCQIIIVDDGSTDGTRKILERIADIDGVEIVLQEANRGKGAALKAGFAKAQGRFVVIQDADLEYDPCDIAAVIEPLLSDKADVVYGSRFLATPEQEQGRRHRVHRLGNRWLTFGSNLLTGLKLTDMETCYKAMKIEMLDGINICQNRFGVEPELTAKLARRGARFFEVPISYDGRSFRAGKKVGVRDLFNAIWCIARYGLFD